MNEEKKGFNQCRRQQFLTEKAYAATRANQDDLIEGEKENLASFTPGTDEHAGSYQMMYLEHFWKWMLDYTAGVSIAALADRFPLIVDAFSEWNEAHQIYLRALYTEFPQDGIYEYMAAPDFEILSDYIDTVQLVSVAILLRDFQSVTRIINIMRSHTGIDALFDELTEAYSGNENIAETCILGAPFEQLATAFHAESDSEILDTIGSYLNKWYSAMADHPRWYNGHLDISSEGISRYYGYWSFESGAVAYLLNIDENSISNLLFPIDLVEYGVSLRERTSIVSDVDFNTTESRLEGGALCNKKGFWETPSRIDSRKLFEVGEVMPNHPTSEYGKTIWHWSADQTIS